MRTPRRIPRASWSIAALLVVLPLILYWPFVFGGKSIFWGTPLLQFWPWRTYAAQELRAGRLPLWNPYAGNGVPLLADHQSAVLYPLNLIFWLFPVEWAMGLSLALHAILAGATTYALARDLGLTRCGSLVSAMAFMLSGYVVARGSFLTEISALPWLPLLWLYGRRLVHRFRVRDVTLLSLAIALQFLAGHAQTWFYSLVSLALYGLWEGWQATKEISVPSRRATVRQEGADHHSSGYPADNGRQAQTVYFWDRTWQWIRRCLPLLWAVMWGVALAAVQFLPTLELSRVAGRAGRADWETFALQYSFWPWRLITLLLPDFFGNPARGDYWGYATYWEDAGYVGVLPFLFALLAVAAWIRWRRRERDRPSALRSVPPFALLALYALLMALGEHTPWYIFFFRHVPGFGAFQAPARWLCIYTPAIALLAGIGVDALRPSARLAFIGRLTVAGAVSIALTTFAAKMLLSDVKTTFFDPLIWFAVLLVPTMLLFLWGQSVREGKTLQIGRLRLGSVVWQAAAILLVAVDLISAGYHLNPAVDASLYGAETEIGTFLAGDGPQGRTLYLAGAREKVMWDRYLDFGDYGPRDVSHWQSMREALLPDLGMVERLPSVNSFEPLLEKRHYTLLEAVQELDRETTLRVGGMMNAAYILEASDLDEERIYRSPSVNVYRNPHVLPRAYVVCQPRFSTPEEALETLLSPEFNATQEVILENPDLAQPAPSNLQTEPCTLQPATLLPSPPNQVKIRAVLPQPGYLVLADTFYPGWQARIDGERTDILRANYAFRAVALDAGEHEVVFRYRPLSFIVGMACSGISLVGVFVVLGKSPNSFLANKVRMAGKRGRALNGTR